MPFITYGKTKLHYEKLGHGHKVMLAFHGFGQDISFYLPVAEALGKEYTVYAFDLFYHGKSWLAPINAPLTKDFLKFLLQQFLEKENIRRFSVMGFSMGGKFALATLESFSSKIDGVFLIAPDGIKTSFWYNVATYPGWLAGIFKRTIVKPKPFFRLVEVMDRYKLMHPGVLRFASFQMNSPAKRFKIYKSWTGFRLLVFDLKSIAFLLNKHAIPATFIVGQFDQIITAKAIKFFTDTLQNCEVVTLKSGHSHLLQEVGRYLKEYSNVKK